MKLSASSGPQTKDGLASRVGVGRGGRVGEGRALIGELTVGLPESVLRDGGEVPINDDSPLDEQGSSSSEHGVAAASEPLDGGVDGSVVGSGACTRVGEADLGAVFEQQPLLDGKQLVQSRLALAQTQFLHLPPPLQRQHCGISQPLSIC